jgi:hypothetical protein
MIGGRDRIVRFQSDFYRNNYYKMLRSLLFTSFVMLALICAIIYFVLLNPPRQYYATTTNGQIIPLKPIVHTEGSS